MRLEDVGIVSTRRVSSVLSVLGRRVFASGVIIFVVLSLFSVAFVPSSWAAGLPGNPIVVQKATLTGPRAEAPIPLYLRPAANQPNVGYGVYGSSVTVLEQLASFLPEADQASTWNHIRLDETPYTEGWVQGRFLALSQEPVSADEGEAEERTSR
ncbi:MAG: hypothetical protein AAFP07_18675 [Cyanobacteria bacterium J06606_4]